MYGVSTATTNFIVLSLISGQPARAGNIFSFIKDVMFLLVFVSKIMRKGVE